jgi:hypothetical protein
MSIRKILLICCLWVPFCQQVLGQVKFSTVVNQKEIGKNDYLQVEYIVENANSVEQLTAPSFTGFTVSSGPMQQSGMSVINGSVTKYEGITFVLQPTSTGRKVIPGATAIIDGKQMRSNPVVVQVTNASSSQGSAQQLNPSPFNLDIPEIMPDINEEYVLRPGENVTEKIKNNLLVKLEVSKTSCYIGEPIIATYKLCSRLKSESKVTRRPTLNGFSVYDMIQPESNSPTVEKIGGKMFNVHIIRKVQLYPLQEGIFELDPAELDNTVRFVRVEGNGSRGSLRQLMDDYFNGMSQGKLEEEHITLGSKPVTITVKPLPEAGKPLSFDGAVGKFSLSAVLTKKEIPADETGELDVLLKGDGNITMINAPAVTWPSGAEAYEPAVKEDINKMVSPLNGTKRFQYPFTVKAPGTVIIPPVEFSYFDPAANAYKTIHTDSLLLRVTKATHPIKKAIASKIDKIIPSSGFNWLNLLWLLPVLIVIALAFFINKRNRKKAVVQTLPVTPVVVKDPFEAARTALQSGDSASFYKEMGRSIWNKLAEKLPVTSSQLNKPVVTSLLRQRAVPETTIAALENILLETEMALYTPVHSTHDMKASLERAELVVNKLDKEITG